MKYILVMSVFVCLGCASLPGHQSTKLPESKKDKISSQENISKRSLQAELGVVDSQIMNVESLLAGAEARLMHYNYFDEPDKEAMVSGLESEINSLKMRKVALKSRKEELKSRILF